MIRVNRLSIVQESGSWSRVYGHDAHGDRWVRSANRSFAFAPPAAQFDADRRRGPACSGGQERQRGPASSAAPRRLFPSRFNLSKLVESLLIDPKLIQDFMEKRREIRSR